MWEVAGIVAEVPDEGDDRTVEIEVELFFEKGRFVDGRLLPL